MVFIIGSACMPIADDNLVRSGDYVTLGDLLSVLLQAGANGGIVGVAPPPVVRKLPGPALYHLVGV